MTRSPGRKSAGALGDGCGVGGAGVVLVATVGVGSALSVGAVGVGSEVVAAESAGLAS